MPSLSSVPSATCTNKREVLNCVKEVLETYVQSGVIDREDFKDLAKKSVEAVAPPITVELITQSTLQQLVDFLSDNGTDEGVIGPIREAAKEATAVNPLSAKVSTVSSAAPVFSLSALQARMTKKREELRRHREVVPVVANEMSRADAPAPASNAPSASVVQPTSVSETRHSSLVDEEEAPVRKCRTEAPAPVPISLPALQDVDLYADLVCNPPGAWHPPLQSTSM